MNRDFAEPIESLACQFDLGVTELPLLLPGWQVTEMERLAHSRGLTLGQQIRLLIRYYGTDQARSSPAGKHP
jgi:hypothetical protein